MKTFKIWFIGGLITALAVAVTGGKPPDSDRPSSVSAAKWIKVSDTTGIEVIERNGGGIVGKWHVKQGSGWVELSVENSARISMVK